MTPQKKIRIGVGFVAIWVLLGGAWLCDYFFGDTEFWKLASGELTVLLGIGAGTAMIPGRAPRAGGCKRCGQRRSTRKSGRRHGGQRRRVAGRRDTGLRDQAGETQAAGSQVGNTAAKSTAARTARQPEEKKR